MRGASIGLGRKSSIHIYTDMGVLIQGGFVQWPSHVEETAVDATESQKREWD